MLQATEISRLTILIIPSATLIPLCNITFISSGMRMWTCLGGRYSATILVWGIGCWKSDTEMQEESKFISRTVTKLILCASFLPMSSSYKDAVPGYQFSVKNDMHM